MDWVFAATVAILLSACLSLLMLWANAASDRESWKSCYERAVQAQQEAHDAAYRVKDELNILKDKLKELGK